jgi:small subunit ribosomal protein S9
MVEIKIDAAIEENTSIEEKPQEAAKADKLGRIYSTGKRKSSIARVWVKKGSGKITINKREASKYFSRDVYNVLVNQPFTVTDTAGQYDVVCTVKGGGTTGQAEAIRHGISRALNLLNPEAYHVLLRKSGLLTRDSRVVERKKFGKKKARKSYQFSKR